MVRLSEDGNNYSASLQCFTSIQFSHFAVSVSVDVGTIVIRSVMSTSISVVWGKLTGGVAPNYDLLLFEGQTVEGRFAGLTTETALFDNLSPATEYRVELTYTGSTQRTSSLDIRTSIKLPLFDSFHSVYKLVGGGSLEFSFLKK